MNREMVIQWACLYGPLFTSGTLALFVRPGRRLATGLLFATFWNAALLPWVDMAAREFGMWHFASPGPHLGGMPLSLYFGWIITWGIAAPLIARLFGNRPLVTALFLLLLDLRLMPELTPILHLGPRWVLGEIVIVLVLLLPSMFIARSTECGTKVAIRCAMLVPSFAGITLGIPYLLITGIENLPDPPDFPWILAAGIATVPGIAAVRDFARGGNGTPVPLDPPTGLVRHGIYGYLRNPMQLSMTALLLIESAYLRSPWPAVLAGLGFVYAEGFARWSEREDLSNRFGKHWDSYRREVRAWIPQWRPSPGETCELWIDRGCLACSNVGSWFEARTPVGLTLEDARDWSGSPLRRIIWRHPPSGRTESGIRAIAMGLQHLSLPYALLAWTIQTPGLSHLLQICLDAAGAGPRETKPS